MFVFDLNGKSNQFDMERGLESVFIDRRNKSPFPDDRVPIFPATRIRLWDIEAVHVAGIASILCVFEDRCDTKMIDTSGQTFPKRTRDEVR